ncbi:unnamed protein product [Euphydryas editha]|uniref:Uncharacterized protein n=1 Tax=Euphydryas editha TaxID=104508 RepID=A0AAU9U107_EUPED|nr:unnamed protein product [Euphydryas editha]
MNETADNDPWMWIRDVMRTWLEDPGVEEHQGLNMSALKMDQAYIVGVTDRDVGVYAVSDDCFRCPFELQKNLSPEAESWWVVNTARRMTWRVYADATEKFTSVRNTSGLLCQLRPNLGEFGVYTLNATGDGCNIRTDREPVDIYMRKY